MESKEFFSRLGQLWEESVERNCDKKCELIEEIFRTFFFQMSPFPKKYTLSLKGHYSHRLLKETFEFLGYSLPKKPNCANLKIRLIEEPK